MHCPRREYDEYSCVILEKNMENFIIKKDYEIVKAKVERKSLALKAKKESSDEECLTSGSEDEEYAMTVRDFKKFFKRRVNHAEIQIILLENVQKPTEDNNQRALVEVFFFSWSDSGEEDDEKIQDETCLVAQAPNEICLGVDLEPDEWIKDSGCSKHMTGNRKLFSTYKAYNGGPALVPAFKRLPKTTHLVKQKQTALAISTTKAEYVSLEKACQQALWMKQALIDYDVRLDDVPIIQYRLSYSNEGQMFVEFVIQNQLFSYSLENFAQILDVPCEGACVFTDRWRLDELAYGIPSDGPYQTNPPSIEDIISSIRID
ncbi:hypothetical protein Tco_0247893 [Tanacetum coccineum]